MSDTMTPTPPGWYEDPSGAAEWRYWDGSEWTDHTAAKDDAWSIDASAESITVPPLPETDASSQKDWTSDDAKPAPVGSGSRFSDLLQSKLLWAGIAAIAAVLAVASITSNAQNGQHPVTGEYVLFDSNRTSQLDVGDRCAGADVGAGILVRAFDAAGEQIGLGHLEAGEVRTVSGSKACVFPLDLEDLSDSPSYRFVVNRRGEVTYPRSEMHNQNWHVSLKIDG